MENEKSVQGTNDSSILSKHSMIKLGYFDDPLLHHFVAKKKSRRSPLINRGYYVRAKAVQFTLDTFIDRFKQEFQVLSLGAGYDSLFFRLAHSNKWPNNSVYCEVDFPELVERKIRLISNNLELKDLLSKNGEIKKENVILDSENYKLVGCDLRDLIILKKALDLRGISRLKPTLVLLECVRTYLDPKSSENLLKWIKDEFQTVVLVSYEQMYCNDGFGLIMLNHFLSLASPLLSIHPSNCDSLNDFYLNLGWKQISVHNMSYFYNSVINNDEKMRVENIEPFDEYEDWHLKCNHYILLCATKGINDFIVFPNSNIIKQNRKTFTWNFVELSDVLQRFGHCSILLNLQIISFGGFGVENKSHKRLTSVNVINLPLENGKSVNLSCDGQIDELLHAQAVVLDSRNCVAIFGGRSSPFKAHDNLSLVKLNARNEIENSTIVECGGEKPAPRWRHSATLVVSDGVEYIVVFGGKSVENEFLGDCFALNTSTWTWKRIQKNEFSPSPRHSHSSVTWMDQVIITCGLGVSCKPLSSLHTFNFKNVAWSCVEIVGLLPRYSHTSHIWKNNLFLVGGVNCDPECLPGVARISLDSWHCVEYSLPILSPEKPVLLHNHSSVFDEKNKQIVVLGGGGNCFSFGTHFNRDLITIDVTQFEFCE